MIGDTSTMGAVEIRHASIPPLFPRPRPFCVPQASHGIGHDERLIRGKEGMMKAARKVVVQRYQQKFSTFTPKWPLDERRGWMSPSYQQQGNPNHDQERTRNGNLLAWSQEVRFTVLWWKFAYNREDKARDPTYTEGKWDRCCLDCHEKRFHLLGVSSKEWLSVFEMHQQILYDHRQIQSRLQPQRYQYVRVCPLHRGE